MEKLISVIVPVYNVEKYINRCLDSIISQTYKNLEIILVNDGSTDNSGKICDEYAEKDNRIKVIHKENGGVSSARNKGIEIAEGSWITFIDSDDWIENNFFEVMISKKNEYQADIVLCGYNRVVGEKIEKINADNTDTEYNSKQYLVKTLNPQTGFGFCHMKLIKKECIDDLRFEERLVVGEDALFNLMISTKIKKAILTEKSIYNYRINNESVVKRYDKNYADKYLNSIKINKQYILEHYENDKEILQNYYNFVAYHIFLIAVNFCFHPDNNEKNKIKLLKQVCNYEEFREGIKKSNYNNISITRKITLFTLKYKLYFITAMICKIRQIQNNIKKER